MYLSLVLSLCPDTGDTGHLEKGSHMLNNTSARGFLDEKQRQALAASGTTRLVRPESQGLARRRIGAVAVAVAVTITLLGLSEPGAPGGTSPEPGPVQQTTVDIDPVGDSGTSGGQELGGGPAEPLRVE